MDDGLQLRAQTGAAGIALPHRIHLNQRHGLMVNGDWRVDLRMRSLGLRFHRITGPTPTGILKINSFVSAGYGTPLAAKSSQQKTYPQIPHSKGVRGGSSHQLSVISYHWCPVYSRRPAC